MNSNKTIYEQRGRYISIPVDYYNSLLNDGQREKASAFLEYFIDMQQEEINSLRFYAQRWAGGKSTVSNWMKEFKEEIAKYYAYWSIKNESYYSSISFKSGQSLDNKKIKSGQQKTQDPHKSEEVKPKVDSNKIKSGQSLDKDLNTYNSNNINADSNESARHSYSTNFEILWNRYDKKTSNKKRSESIYKKRWKNTDIKILIEAIDKYKASINLTFLKDFDGFLNGIIDPYVPRRAYVISKDGKKYIGYFYDKENKFISDELKTLKVDSANIAQYIQEKRFGYIG